MSQTDRQTDKATHWKTAVFDVEDNWSRLDAPPPAFIKFVKRKKEICPTTGKEHFQIHVCCNKQVRLSQMCSYIKHTKWFAVLGDQHIKNSLAYIEKQETTAPGAQVETIQGERYYRIHELFIEIAKFAEVESDTAPGGWNTNTWDWITCRMVHSDLKWASKLANPSLRRMWDTWRFAFIGKVSEWTAETAGAFIIEAPAEGEALVAPEDEDLFGFQED